MELLAKVATYEQNIILHQAYAHLGLEKFIIWFFAGPMAMVRVIVQISIWKSAPLKCSPKFGSPIYQACFLLFFSVYFSSEVQHCCLPVIYLFDLLHYPLISSYEI